MVIKTELKDGVIEISYPCDPALGGMASAVLFPVECSAVMNQRPGLFAQLITEIRKIPMKELSSRQVSETVRHSDFFSVLTTVSKTIPLVITSSIDHYFCHAIASKMVIDDTSTDEDFQRFCLLYEMSVGRDVEITDLDKSQIKKGCLRFICSYTNSFWPDKTIYEEGTITNLSDPEKRSFGCRFVDYTQFPDK